MIKIRLFDRDGTFLRDGEIQEFYVRPDAVVDKEGNVYVTKAAEGERHYLEYTMVQSTEVS